MYTSAIRQRVNDNLNRADPGIDSKMADWVNDAKRRIEQLLSMEYMRNVTKTLTVTNSAPTAALPTRLKALLHVMYRKTLPVGEEELSWTEIPKLGEAEVARIEDYTSAGVIATGAPDGYTEEETTLTVHPKPESGKTYTLYLIYYAFSADWTFAALEEPYLAKFAWQAVINAATALGFSSLQEHQDAQVWESKFGETFTEFSQNEMKRAMEGEITLRPSVGAGIRRASRTMGWGRI